MDVIEKKQKQNKTTQKFKDLFPVAGKYPNKEPGPHPSYSPRSRSFCNSHWAQGNMGLADYLVSYYLFSSENFKTFYQHRLILITLTCCSIVLIL